jgi:hypothetical protein
MRDGGSCAGLLMVQGMLLPNSAEVKLFSLRPKAGAIEMHLRACRSDAVCTQNRVPTAALASCDALRILTELCPDAPSFPSARSRAFGLYIEGPLDVREEGTEACVGRAKIRINENEACLNCGPGVVKGRGMKRRHGNLPHSEHVLPRVYRERWLTLTLTREPIAFVWGDSHKNQP